MNTSFSEFVYYIALEPTFEKKIKLLVLWVAQVEE